MVVSILQPLPLTLPLLYSPRITPGSVCPEPLDNGGSSCMVHLLHNTILMWVNTILLLHHKVTWEEFLVVQMVDRVEDSRQDGFLESSILPHHISLGGGHKCFHHKLVTWLDAGGLSCGLPLCPLQFALLHHLCH